MKSKSGLEVDGVGVETVDMMAVRNDEMRRWAALTGMAAAVICLPSLVKPFWRRSESVLTQYSPIAFLNQDPGSIVVNCTGRSCQLFEDEETTKLLKPGRRCSSRHISFVAPRPYVAVAALPP